MQVEERAHESFDPRGPVAGCCSVFRTAQAQTPNDPEIAACKATGLVALKERSPSVKDIILDMDTLTVSKANTKIEDTPVRTIIMGEVYRAKGDRESAAVSLPHRRDRQMPDGEGDPAVITFGKVVVTVERRLRQLFSAAWCQLEDHWRSRGLVSTNHSPSRAPCGAIGGGGVGDNDDQAGGCWRWPRSMMAAPGPKRLGSGCVGLQTVR